jgi:glycosyltransferase involved in cell wall biosynthesis
MEDSLTRFADWVVANSEAGRDFLIQRGVSSDRIKVIYNGIDLDRLRVSREDTEQVRRQLGVTSDGRAIGILARLFPQKRHDVFLRAAAIIHQVMPDVKVSIVGDGPLRSQLENLSSELGLGERVVFFGEQKNVGAYLSALDIAVLPSETEGCSNSILEAMALGKPVVATEAGGNRELISDGETGLLVPLGDADALAHSVMKLLSNRSAAQEMGQKARQAVASRFSVENMVNQYQSLYEETLQRKTAARSGAN